MYLSDMKLSEGKQQFIETWGRLGSEWGISRTMAQVHALLLVSEEPLSTERIMELLSISRGNCNMNVRELINWNLVRKKLVPGERKEFFIAEKDTWTFAKRIVEERRRREIAPLKSELADLSKLDGEDKSFTKQMKELGGFVNKLDGSVDTLMRLEEKWFFSGLKKLIK